MRSVRQAVLVPLAIAPLGVLDPEGGGVADLLHRVRREQPYGVHRPHVDLVPPGPLRQRKRQGRVASSCVCVWGGVVAGRSVGGGGPGSEHAGGRRDPQLLQGRALALGAFQQGVQLRCV